MFLSEIVRCLYLTVLDLFGTGLRLVSCLRYLDKFEVRCIVYFISSFFLLITLTHDEADGYLFLLLEMKSLNDIVLII